MFNFEVKIQKWDEQYKNSQEYARKIIVKIGNISEVKQHRVYNYAKKQAVAAQTVLDQGRKNFKKLQSVLDRDALNFTYAIEILKQFFVWLYSSENLASEANNDMPEFIEFLKKNKKKNEDKSLYDSNIDLTKTYILAFTKMYKSGNTDKAKDMIYQILVLLITNYLINHELYIMTKISTFQKGQGAMLE